MADFPVDSKRDSKRDPVRTELDTPTRGVRRKWIDIDGDAVGAFAERIARFFGTGDYLLWQTVFVVAWIVVNVFVVVARFDPYPFILLNLAFSTQAAYAAPLILLAQNRQEDRDRIALAEDRRRAEQTKADTEFLARELASVRVSMGQTLTRDYLRHELEDLRAHLNRIEAKLDDASAARAARAHQEDPSAPHDLGEPTAGA